MSTRHQNACELSFETSGRVDLGFKAWPPFFFSISRTLTDGRRCVHKFAKLYHAPKQSIVGTEHQFVAMWQQHRFSKAGSTPPTPYSSFVCLPRQMIDYYILCFTTFTNQITGPKRLIYNQ
mmetsp:Transcript_53108/g.128939  ORF Transcript_53108/g.128939 Transcript_53108/m.128939 type:complete len:121 (-) Transcript_53108:48-410(-)